MIEVLALLLHLARDDGRYAQSPLKEWFNGLSSRRGPCCSDADGQNVRDADWRPKGQGYEVFLDGEWIEVPETALITEPNRAGRTMVWIYYNDGKVQIRCFMPGAMI